MSSHNSIVATYANHHLAENTVKKLLQAGFDMRKLSIVGKDQSDIRELDGATVLDNLGALDMVHYSCIPRERVPDYEDELKVDRLLLFAHGTPDEIEQAKKIIDLAHPESWDGKVDCSVYYGCDD